MNIRMQYKAILLLILSLAVILPGCGGSGEPKVVVPTPVPPTRALTAMARSIDRTDLHFHSLRHTHASLMLTAGVHPKVVSERLGCSSISVTMDIYSHVLPGLQEDAVDRLEKLLERARA